MPIHLRLRIHRTDGKTGSYSQKDERRAKVLLQRLDPETIFSSGPIVVGTLNPFSILNADEVCWVEVETGLVTKKIRPPSVDQVRKLSGREEYEAILARQWPRWRSSKQPDVPGKLIEALIELSLRSGAYLYLHVTGVIAKTPLTRLIFGTPATTATFEPDGTVYINPKCIVRARVYHSMKVVSFPNGLWCAEADDI